MEDKKAQSFFDIFVVMVIVVFMLIGFAILMFVFNKIDVSFKDAFRNSDTTIVNMSEVNDMTISKFNSGMGMLRLVSFAIIFGMIILILLSNFLIKVNPIYFLFYILMTVLAVIVSVFISNFYQGLLSDINLGSYLLQLKEGTFFMLYLPYFVTVIGIMGAIFLMIGILKDTGSGGDGF
jgi:hypothetical protein